MNSFQAQFNSLLGLALGAKTFGEKQAKKTLGTPKAPTAETPTKQTKKQGEYNAEATFDFNLPFTTSTATLDKDTQMRELAKQRSMQNLINRHEALRAVKAARMKENIMNVEKSKMSDTPLGAIKSHTKGDN